jgi:hypothetical protein
MEELERENIELKAQLEEAQEILAANEIENAFRLKDEQKQQQEKQQVPQSNKFREHNNNDFAVLRKQHNNTIQQLKALKQEVARLQEEKKRSALMSEEILHNAQKQQQLSPRSGDIDTANTVLTNASTEMEVDDKASGRSSGTDIDEVLHSQVARPSQGLASSSQALLLALQLLLPEMHRLAQLSRNALEMGAPKVSTEGTESSFASASGSLNKSGRSRSGGRSRNLSRRSSASGASTFSGTISSHGGTIETIPDSGQLPRLMEAYERTLQAAALAHPVPLDVLVHALVCLGKDLTALPDGGAGDDVAAALVQCCRVLAEIIALVPRNDDSNTEHEEGSAYTPRATKDLRGSFAAAAAGAAGAAHEQVPGRGKKRGRPVGKSNISSLSPCDSLNVPQVSATVVSAAWKRNSRNKSESRVGRLVIAEAAMLLRDVCRSSLYRKTKVSQKGSVNIPSSSIKGTGNITSSVARSPNASVLGSAEYAYKPNEIESPLESAIVAVLIGCMQCDTIKAYEQDEEGDERHALVELLPLLRVYEGRRAPLLSIVTEPYAGPRTRILLLESLLSLLQSPLAFKVFVEAELTLTAPILEANPLTAAEASGGGSKDSPGFVMEKESFLLAFIQRYLQSKDPYTYLTTEDMNCKICAVRFLQRLLRTHGQVFVRLLFRQDTRGLLALDADENTSNGKKKRGVVLQEPSIDESESDSSAVTLLADYWRHTVRSLDSAPPLLLEGTMEHHVAILVTELTQLLNGIAAEAGFDQWTNLMDHSLKHINATISSWENDAHELHHAALKSSTRSIESLDRGCDDLYVAMSRDQM